MVKVTKHKTKGNGFLRRLFSGSLSRKKSLSTAASAPKVRKKPAKAARKPIRATLKARKLRLSAEKRHRIVAKKARAMHSAVGHTKVIVRATIRKPIVRREIMMPAAWSRVEKYKKVKKDGYGYGDYS